MKKLIFSISLSAVFLSFGCTAPLAIYNERYDLTANIQSLVVASNGIYCGQVDALQMPETGKAIYSNRVQLGIIQLQSFIVDSSLKGPNYKHLDIQSFSLGSDTSDRMPDPLPSHKRYLVFLKTLDKQSALFQFSNAYAYSIPLSSTGINRWNKETNTEFKIAGELINSVAKSSIPDALTQLDALTFLSWPPSFLTEFKKLEPSLSPSLIAPWLAARIQHHDGTACKTLKKLADSSKLTKEDIQRINRVFFRLSLSEKELPDFFPLLTLSDLELKARVFRVIDNTLSSINDWPKELNSFFPNRGAFESSLNDFKKNYPQY